MALEAVYIVGCVILHFAIPRKPLESTTGLVLLGLGLVAFAITLTYIAKRRYR